MEYVIIAVPFIIAALWLVQIIKGAGHWHTTGRNKVVETPLKNGYMRSQEFYEQVDLDTENRTRWEKYDGYTIIAPTGARSYVDTTDYSM